MLPAGVETVFARRYFRLCGGHHWQRMFTPFVRFNFCILQKPEKELQPLLRFRDDDCCPLFRFEELEFGLDAGHFFLIGLLITVAILGIKVVFKILIMINNPTDAQKPIEW